MSARSMIRGRASAGTVCSMLALATAMAAAPARAQQVPQPSYNLAGNPTVASGSVTFDRGVTTPGTDVYTVGSATAVLDLTPSDAATGGGVINFQNAGTTAVYTSAPGGPAYTVLNRIVPADRSRPIAFNGTVVSQLQTAAGANTRGGTVWFYSPGGIVVGDGSVFDVGSLLLTTGDPTGGSGTIGSTNNFTLASTPDGGGIVNILSGGSLRATAENSYIALVAPIVLQAGTVNVNGAAAYVAAETASLSFNQGLFDINVTVGSSAGGGFPLQIRGSTTGPASTGGTDNHGIYAVAVPKNDAITMIVAPTGDLGFTPATSAAIENGAIYLQAGGNLSVFPTNPVINRIQALPQSTVAADILFQPAGNVTSQVSAQASRIAEISTAGAGTISFARDVYLYGAQSALIQANAGGTLNFARDVTANAFGNGAIGTATIRAAAGGTISATGTAAVFAEPGARSRPTAFNVATGGIALIESIGTLTAGSLLASAQARPAVGVSGQGGSAGIAASGGGTIATPGSVQILSDAVAFGAGVVGSGGTSTLNVDGGAVSVGGALTISATGGSGNANPSLASGRGGTAQLTGGSGGGTLGVTGATSLDASGTGASATGSEAGTLGAGTGGVAQVQLLATAAGATTTATLAGLTVTANGTGGSAANATASGGAATGGAAIVQTNAGTTLTAGATTLTAGARGGASAATTAGAANGGSASLSAGGAVTVASLFVAAQATGGTKTGGAGDAGAGQAGSALLQAIDGGVLAVTGNARVEAIGLGGSVTRGTGSGGAGSGADARVTANGGGRITLGSADIGAGGVGGAGLGAGSAGGAGTGLTASISQGTGGSVAVGGNAFLSANGIGGASSGGAGGTAQAGDVRFVSNDGAISAGGVAQLVAQANGGAGVTGGAARGGLANIGAGTGSTTVTGNAQVDGSAFGGEGFAGNGGAATGGQGLIGTIGTGTITLGSTATLAASATGGAGAGAGATGGLANGGTSQLFAPRGRVTAADVVTIASNGTGGDKLGTGGAGGRGTGGLATLSASSGTAALSGPVSLSANGNGGNSADAAGAGTGGTVQIGVSLMADGTGGGGSVSSGAASLSATASGGTITNRASTGAGGTARGGTANILANAGNITLASATLNAGGMASVGSDGAAAPALGGQVEVAASGGDIVVTNSLIGSAGASGGLIVNTDTGDGGDATGGDVTVRVATGRRLAIGQTLQVSAIGIGGQTRDAGDRIAGNGIGGNLSITANGTISAAAIFAGASGRGGDVGIFATRGAGNAGGAGVAGTSTITAAGGTLTAANLTNSSDGFGGLGGPGGTGGSGTGGLARLGTAQGGTVRVSGSTIVSARGSGGGAPNLGAGGTGGAGQGGDSTEGRRGAVIIAQDGTIVLGTGTTLTAEASGGTGYGTGAGGSAAGGLANLAAVNGTLDATAGRVIVYTGGFGGQSLVTTTGAGGGAGGAGTGGRSIVTAATRATAATAAGRLLLDTIEVDASGEGGGGSAGAAGLAGGAGGAGTGGRTELLAAAGNGLLTVNQATISSDGYGGNGGAGGAVNTAGEAGTGGTGGVGTGGDGNTGTFSGADSTFATGSATFGSVFICSLGEGGGGGDAAAGGIAGAGGAGIAGGYTLLSRGAPVTADLVTILVNGAGGVGGNGGAGAGGRGEGGSAVLLATNRFNAPATRGGTTIQQLITDTGATGGDTAAATVGGVTQIDVVNSDVSVTNLFATTAGAVAPTGFISRLSVAGGTLTVPTLAMTAVGDIGLITGEGGVLAIDSAVLTAGGTIVDEDATGPVTGGGGDTDIGSLFATLGGDFLADEDIVLGGSLALVVGGRIQTRAIDAASVDLTAGGGIATGTIGSALSVSATSGGDLTVLDVTAAGGSVDLTAGGAMTIGAVRAADAIGLTAGGSLTAGNLTALTSPEGLGDGASGAVTVAANGDIRLGDVLGLNIDIDGTDLGDGPFGSIVTGTLTGEFIEVLGGQAVSVAGVRTAELFSGGDGDLNVYAAEIGADAGNLTVGDIASLGLVALASNGGSVTAGTVTTPSSIVALARTGVTFAGATTGRGATDSLFVANASMLETTPALAAVLADDEAGFDTAILTGLTPVRIGGSFTSTGPIATGNLLAAAQGGVALGAIDATTRIALDSGAAITLGDVTTPASLALLSDGAIRTGAIVADEVAFASTGGTITTGAISVQDGIVLTALSAAGTIATGALRTVDDGIDVRAGGGVTIASATLVNGPVRGAFGGIGIIAGNSLTIGAIDSASGIGLLSRSAGIATGALTARGGSALLLAVTNVATGAISVAESGTAYIGNASQFPASFNPATDRFDPTPILAAAPVRVGGTIALGGPVSAGAFRSASSGATTAQAITAGGALSIDSGGGASLGAIGAGTSAYVGGTGAVTIAGASVARGRLTVDTAGNIALGQMTTGTDTLLIATGGRIDAGGPITAGGSIALLADRGLAAGALTASRNDGAFVYLAGTTNRERIGADGNFLPSFATDAGSILLAGAVTVAGPVSGGLIRASVDGAARFDGTLDGAQRVRLFGRTLTVNGSVAGPAIELFGTDLALARGITVGGAATQTIAIGTLSTAAPTTLGGSGGDGAAGFTLDAAEIAQLRGGSIAFGQSTRFGSGDEPIVLRDLTLVGTDGGQAANLTAAGGAFTITSLGDIRVLGAVRMNNAAAGNALVLNAADSFDLVTDAGSIGLFGAGEALSGRLAISAVDIASADAALFARADATDFDDIEPAAAIAAIGAPAARTRAEGFIQAGRLELAATDTIVIQNSGTAALAGGFTAGSGGMSVTRRIADDGAADPLAVVIYGRVQGEAGMFRSNADTRGAISFQPQGTQAGPLSGFADFSVVNGCALLASVACNGGGGGTVRPPEQEMAEVTIGTDVLGIVDGALSQAADEGGVAAVPDVRLTTVIDSAALTTDSIVTDPFGSGGNASLWEGGDADGAAGSRGEDDERRRPAGAEGGR
ncbi:hypothetical protein [Sphingomonas profundi]|uniref:hypothetical protein n=1 Tax=Alterirhizorhabdus profundi TaxID=2681549 RepID=UPI0012E81625|nr:hypothetical protein [Sphingomonas profundi]